MCKAAGTMKFSVGYQLRRDADFIDELIFRRDRVREVYFSWGRMPNGRGSAERHEEFTAIEAQERMLYDLARLNDAGIPFNMLFNGACYGGRSLSKALLNEVGDTLATLEGRFNVESVTTTSPVIAHFIKVNFPELAVRASVNMEIGTVQGMSYLAEDFDGFYLKREYNYIPEKIDTMYAWCRENGKSLHLLANSGCLNYCSARQFHDSLVSHEEEIAATDNAVQYRSLCSKWLADKVHRQHILEIMNMLRPEDIHLYEKWFDSVKLATRVSRDPVRTLRAYCEGSFCGNLLELTEPNHAGLFYPVIIDNSRIPADYCERRWSCTGNCAVCGYCRSVFDSAMVNVGDVPVL